MRIPVSDKENQKIIVMAALIVFCCFLTVYFHLVLRSCTIFTHFFYIPIILAAFWWKRKGIVVAVFLAGVLLAGHHLFIGYAGINYISEFDECIRAIFFVLISVVVALMSERIAREEKGIKDSHAELDQIFQTAADGMWVVDRDFNVLRMNDTFLELAGLSREDAAGRKCYEVFPGPRCHTPDCPLSRILGGEKQDEKEMERVRADGKTIPCNVIATPFKDSGGKIIGIVEDFRDITERRQAEVQREMFIKELELKNTELERFTYTVSHDLKSPLITIKGFAGLLEDDALKGDPLLLKKDIQRINAAADTMYALLTDLLELSRVGRIVNPPEKIGFGTIAHEAVDLLAGPLVGRGVTVDIAPDLPDVNVDHARIRDVMVNLIENAVKFLGDQPDPVIRIGADTTGATPVFFVQDNGIGIDPRYLERIFNLFEKLDLSRPGTGIGLAIVRRIIEVHGGKCWAESEGSGKGATFRFTLPLAHDAGGADSGEGR
ncbi:MAG: PAS domain S-box protein [Methanoregula sp.]|nr:PAS domain S-box protein [Methanoregula sp.]